jgi:hypothetical protein
MNESKATGHLPPSMKIDMRRKELDEIKIYALDENTLLTALTDGPSHTKIRLDVEIATADRIFPELQQDTSGSEGERLGG